MDSIIIIIGIVAWSGWITACLIHRRNVLFCRKHGKEVPDTIWAYVVMFAIWPHYLLKRKRD